MVKIRFTSLIAVHVCVRCLSRKLRKRRDRLAVHQTASTARSSQYRDALSRLNYRESSEAIWMNLAQGGARLALLLLGRVGTTHVACGRRMMA